MVFDLSILPINYQGIELTLLSASMIFLFIFYPISKKDGKKRDSALYTLSVAVSIVLISIFLFYLSLINGNLIVEIINFLNGTNEKLSTVSVIFYLPQLIAVYVFLYTRSKLKKPLYTYPSKFPHMLSKFLSFLPIVLIVLLPFFAVSYFNEYYSIYTNKIFLWLSSSVIYDYILFIFFGFMYSLLEGFEKWGRIFKFNILFLFNKIGSHKVYLIVFIILIIFSAIYPPILFPDINRNESTISRIFLLNSSTNPVFINETSTIIAVKPHLLNWLVIRHMDPNDRVTSTYSDVTYLRNVSTIKFDSFSENRNYTVFKNHRYTISNSIKIEQIRHNNTFYSFELTFPDFESELIINDFVFERFIKSQLGDCTIKCNNDYGGRYCSSDTRFFGNNELHFTGRIFNGSASNKFLLNVSCQEVI